VEKDLIPGLRRRGDIWVVAHRQIDADARTHDVDCDQADDQRQRRDNLEVDDCPQSHAADYLEVASTGDPRDQGREDQGRDDHLDQAQEQLAEGAKVRCERRVVLADQPPSDNANGQPDENLLS
jgi:hypothetical protein